MFRRKQDTARTERFHAVIERSSDTLVAVGQNKHAVILLSEMLVDTTYVLDIRMNVALITNLESNPRQCPEWTWDFSKWVFKTTLPSLINNYKRERSTLAQKKLIALGRAMYWVNRIRARSNTGIDMQTAVYAEKQRQAKLYKDSGFKDDVLRDQFYVTQYAEISGLSNVDAAEEILLQARLDHEYLAKSEKLRLTLIKAIREATEAAEIDELLNSYREYGTL